MKNTLKRSLALLLVLLFAIPTFAFAEDLGVEAVSVEDIALVEDVATDDVVVEQAEEAVEEDNLLAEANEVLLGEEEEEEIAEENQAGFFTVNFYLEGGKPANGKTFAEYESQSIAPNNLVAKPANPVRYGYTFAGWAADGKIWDFATDTVGNADVGLTAQWTPKSITVLFVPNNGGADITVSTNYGEIPAAPTVTKAGSAFAGWYVDEGTTKKFLFAKTDGVGPYKIDADTDAKVDFTEKEGDGLNARYEAQFKASETVVAGVAAETSFTYPTIKLFAKWSPEYTVRFWNEKADTAKDSPIKTLNALTSTSKIAKLSSSEAPTKAGFKLDGWNCNTYKWDFDTTIGNQTFYATYPDTRVIDLFPDFVADTHKLTYVLGAEESIKPETGLTKVSGYNTWEDTVPYDTFATERTATKEGWLFKGWFTNSQLTDAFSYATKPTADKTLYPKFVKGYNIEYYRVQKDTTAAPEFLSKVLTEENTNPVQPADPTYPNAKFMGWFEDAGLTTPFVFTAKTMTSAGLKAYAKFDYSEGITTHKVDIFYYKVNADANANEWAHDVQYVVDKDTATVPAAMKTEVVGKTLKGWKVGTSFSGDTPVASATDFVFTTQITQNTIVVADYDAKKLKVTFDTNGGSTVPSQDVDYGGFPTEPTLPTKKHYKNNASNSGWYLDSKLTTKYSFSGDAYRITKDTTLYFKWVGDDVKVSFYKQEGDTNTVWSNNVEYGSTIDPNLLDDNVKKPANGTKEFVGWYNGSQKIDIYTTKFTPSDADMDAHKEIKVYGKWATTRYTVTFDTQGGTAVDPQAVQAGGYVADPDANPATKSKREGMRLAFWATEKNASAEKAWMFGNAAPAKYKINEDTTLYANWRMAEYDVTFAGNFVDSYTGANGAGEAQKVEHGKAAKKPTTDPTMKGDVTGAYKFDGWFTDVERTKAYDFKTGIVADTTLYARFAEAVPVTFYSFTADTAPQVINKIGTSGTVKVKKGTPATQPSAAEASMPGMKLVGWYAEDDTNAGHPSTKAFDFTKNLTAETKVYGKYEAATTHEVHFVYNGGKDASGKIGCTQYVVDNDTVTAPAVTYEGKTLVGWYESATAATPYDFTAKVTGDLDLTARWQDEMATVTVVTNGGTAVDPIKVAVNTKSYGYYFNASTPITTKDGFQPEFYNDADFTSPIVMGQMITADATVYTKWLPREYEFTFMYATHPLTMQKYKYVKYNEAAVEPAPADVAKALTNLQTAYSNDPDLSVSAVGGVLGEIKGIAGWYTDSQLRYPYDWATPATKDTKLYGKFLNAVKVSVKANNKVYDGKAIEPVIEVTPVVSGDPVPTTKVEYKVKGEAETTFTTTAPKDYGTYVVRVTAEANDKTAFNQASAEFTISQAEITLTWPENTALPFTGSEQAPVPTVVGAVAGETPAMTITGKQIKVGTGYKAVATLPATGNYKFATTAVTECAFSIVENTVAPSKVEVKLDPTTGLPVGLILTNADGSTTEVPIDGNDIFEVVKKDNGDGTGTVTITPKAGSGYKFDPITTTYAEALPKATKITKIWAGKKKAKVEWETVGNVDGYEIQYGLKKAAAKKAKPKNVTGATIAEKTFKKLKKGKKYYFRIRTYKVGADGKKVYSVWSGFKSKKIK